MTSQGVQDSTQAVELSEDGKKQFLDVSYHLIKKADLEEALIGTKCLSLHFTNIY